VTAPVASGGSPLHTSRPSIDRSAHLSLSALLFLFLYEEVPRQEIGPGFEWKRRHQSPSLTAPVLRLNSKRVSSGEDNSVLLI
jgi:hypothetical protein